MSFAYLPLYTGDYLRDTQHLSCSEHGCYLKLLMYCWDQKGPVPLDERRQLGIVNARSTDEIEALRRVITEFFVRMEDGYYNKRLQQEIARSEALSSKRRQAGEKGGKARANSLPQKGKEAIAKQVPSNSQANAKQEPLSLSLYKPPLNPTGFDGVEGIDGLERERAQKRALPAKSRGERLSPGFVPPQEWLDWAKREKGNIDVNACYNKFHDHWVAAGGRWAYKVDWFAAWKNWVRQERERA